MKHPLFGDLNELRAILLRVAGKMHASPDEREDLAQEALLRLFTHETAIQSAVHAKAYAITTVRNLKIENDRLRRKFFEEWDDKIELTTASPDGEQYFSLLLKQTLECVEALDKGEADAIMLAAIGEDLTAQARARGLSKSSLVQRAKRGREKLRIDMREAA